jgi:hypothetical protein
MGLVRSKAGGEKKTENKNRENSIEFKHTG